MTGISLNASNRHHWLFATRKLVDPRWEAPHGAKLSFEIEPSESGNTLAVQLKTDSWRFYSGKKPDTWTALVHLPKSGRQHVDLTSDAFKNSSGEMLNDWHGLTELIFQSGAKAQPSTIDELKHWKGKVPAFSNLHWTGGEPVTRRKPFLPMDSNNAEGQTTD